MAKVLKRPQYQTIHGIMSPAMFSPKCFQEALDYKPTASDVILVTYPKCGTTWMQNIALYIFRKGKELNNPDDFFAMCPFIDMLGADSIQKMAKPGIMKTHLPYSHMPYSPDARYIFVARNPKDCCVSLYHHTKMLPGLGYWDGVFDDFFELFMAGEVEYNDYFDHLLSWYPHRNDPKVFYTTYEDMKKDTKNVIFKVANFLGKEYGEIVEKDNTVLNNILYFSGFEYMKKNLASLFDTYSLRELIKKDPSTSEGTKYLIDFTESLGVPEERPKMEFVRKGVVGDWKNYFTNEQAERLNNKFLERTKDTEIQNWFSVQ